MNCNQRRDKKLVEVKEEDLEQEATPSESKEAEDQPEPAIDVAKEIAEFQEKKKQIEEQREQEKEQHPKPAPKKTEIDMSHFNAFKEKIIKDFELTSKVDSAGHHLMYYKDFLVVKLLPRKNWWYGICREVPEQDNIWKAFRIHNAKEEQPHYEHIKKFVEINSQEN